MSLLARRPERLWLLLWGALLLAALAGAASYAWAKHRWAVNRLADIEPRYARLAGLRDAGPQIDALQRDLAGTQFDTRREIALGGEEPDGFLA